ncbi:hypothetical protein [Lonsdalea quercina]|uniref:hypothetical protein n=1 Tax=Lonsdalea quercina TaxID=71657 RepID=UPI003976779A
MLSHKLGDLVTMKSGFDAHVSVAKKAAKRALIEAAAPIRDNPIVSELLMTGIDARVEFAKNRFRLNVDAVKKQTSFQSNLFRSLFLVPI